MKFVYIALITLLVFGCSGDFGKDQNIIRIKGSDTMLLLNKKLAEEFMKENPGISIYIEGGGTKTGIQALLNNTVEICAASRPLEPSEIKQFGDNFSTVGMSFLIGRDALSIFINPKNKIRNLSLDELTKIFTCKITNWEELGGTNTPIKAISRSSVSGTHLYFRKHVLGGENICNKLPTVNTTREIIDFVKNDINAIGYGGIGYSEEDIQCSINEIKPNRENVLNNSYPISRYLRYYTSRKPKGNIKLFVDWVSSEKGQQIVESSGYIPLWK